MNREELINEVITGYGNTGRLLKSYMHESGSHQEIGPSQLHLLFSIASWVPAPTQKVLAQYLHVTPGALSQLIDPLVEAGYITRQTNETDRRMVHLALSAKGKQQFDEMKADRSKLFAVLLQSLSDDELQVMLSAQRKMFEALENHYKQKGKA
jgi:DNA-binding MarR family transcriptional regulator